MALILTYDQWIKDTHSMVKPRSESLKKIDDAIKSRNEMETKKALINWINEQNSKKQDWHRSVRNEKGAVKKLYDQLGVLGSAVAYNNIGAEMDDKLAKADIKRSQRLAAARMFTDKEIKFKDSFWGISRGRCKAEATKVERAINATKNTALSAKGIGSNLSTAKEVGDSLRTVIKTIMGESFPAATHNAIIEHVFGKSVEEFIFSATPLFGLVSSGGHAVKEWVGVAYKIHQATEMESRYGDVRTGDASSAMQAMVSIIDREIKKQVADATIRTTAFTAKGISALADGGTASTSCIGAIESIAIILNNLVDIVIDARQMIAGNKLIAAQKIDLTLFNECPILGCYYIVIQDHSTIMNFDLANMGKENWKQEAERLRYAIDPVIKKATELIGKSRIEIKGMEMAKGVYQKTLWDKIKQVKAEYFRGKTQMSGTGSDDILQLVAEGIV